MSLSPVCIFAVLFLYFECGCRLTLYHSSRRFRRDMRLFRSFAVAFLVFFFLYHHPRLQADR